MCTVAEFNAALRNIKLFIPPSEKPKPQPFTVTGYTFGPLSFRIKNIVFLATLRKSNFKTIRPTQRPILTCRVAKLNAVVCLVSRAWKLI